MAVLIVLHAMVILRYFPFAGYISRSSGASSSWPLFLVNVALHQHFSSVHIVVYRFIFGQCRFRLFYGFRETEIVIRKLTDKGHNLRSTLRDDVFKKMFYDSATSTVMSIYNPASRPKDDILSLDYQAILEAHALTEIGDIPEKLWDYTIWERRPEGSTRWLFMAVWKVIHMSDRENDVFKVRYAAVL